MHMQQHLNRRPAESAEYLSHLQPSHSKYGGDESSVQRMSAYSAIANGPAPIQRHAAPQGGLPANLKSGIEGLSGIAMDDVRVHYNSSKPAQLQAHAYAQGTDIHIAPGQERHLPHEAWHVVQQKQGRVKPTLQLKGVAINDDSALEREADVMGERAMGAPSSRSEEPSQRNLGQHISQRAPIQRLRYSKTEVFSGNDMLLEAPYFLALSIVKHCKENKLEIEGDAPTIVQNVPIKYSSVGGQMNFEINKTDLEWLEAMVEAQTPQGKAKRAKQAQWAGDDNPDSNPSAFQGNCGYCVISDIMGIENADIAYTKMAEAKIATPDPNSGMTIEYMRNVLLSGGKSVSQVMTANGKAGLEALLKKGPENQSSTFVLRFDHHLIYARINEDVITIHDPQVNDQFSIMYMPDAKYHVLAIKD